jgi:hypothetical protein
MNNGEVNKKLRNLSKKLEAESSKSMAGFDADCFSPQEKQLFAKVDEIVAKGNFENLPYEAIMENLDLVSKAYEIKMRKAAQLFTFFMSNLCGGGEVETWFFNQFFYNFIIDYMEGLETISKCSEKQRNDFLAYLKENDKLGTVFKIRPWEPKYFVLLAVSLGYDDLKKINKRKKNKEKKNNAVN